MCDLHKAYLAPSSLSLARESTSSVRMQTRMYVRMQTRSWPYYSTHPHTALTPQDSKRPSLIPACPLHLHGGSASLRQRYVSS